MASYSRWEIIYAWIPNSDGSPPDHAHPCIYLGESRKSKDLIIVAGITSDYAYWHDEYSWRMPWAEDGNCETRLTKDCFAQTHWIHHIPLVQVRGYHGYTPQADQIEISRRLELYLRRKQSGEA